MTDRRTMLVPDGLAGERVDAAISRLFGLSRSRAADLATDGEVSVNGSTVSKSHRVHAEDLLEVVLPGTEPSVTLEIVAEPVPGMRIVHDDDEIVVVDKPVGVAAHPSLNWTGPNVLSGLKAAGYRISTSGASERQGIVSRLDVGTSGLMVVCKSERAYTVLKRAFKERRVDKTYHALVQGLPDPLVGTIDAPIGRRPGAEFKFAGDWSRFADFASWRGSDEAFKIGNRIALMEGGRIVQCGTAREIIANPVSDYVADFVNHMNPLSVLTARDAVEPTPNAIPTDGQTDVDTPIKDVMARLKDETRALEVTDHGQVVGQVSRRTVIARLLDPRG